MSRRTFALGSRLATGLLVAGGLCVADLPAQEPPPPPTPEASGGVEPEESPQRAPAREARSAGVGLGVDVVTTPQGVFVVGVREDGPAAKVGLRRGDQIVSFAGQRASTADELLGVIGQQQAESTVKAEVRRNGALVDMAIVLASGADAEDRNVTRQPAPPERRPGAADQVRTDAPQPRRAPDADRQQEQRQTARYQPPPVWAGFVLRRAPLGVAIERLHPQGPARQAGLRIGDRIVRVNGHVAAEPDEIYATIEQRQPGDELRLTVLRGEELIEGAIELEAPPPGVAEQPVDGFGPAAPEVARLVEQQRQNTEMIQELLLEVRMLRQELEELRSGRRAAP